MPSVGARNERRRRMGIKRQERLFLDFYTWGYDAKRWSKETRTKYRNRARHANGWMEEHRGKSLFWCTHKDLLAYLFTINGSARNRNNSRQALVGFFEFAVDIGVRDDNPALGLPRLPEPRYLPKAMSVEDAQGLLRAAKALGKIEYLVVLTFLYTGFRRANIVNLEWKNFSPDMRWCRVMVKSRGGKELEIPVHPLLRKALEGWKARSKEPRWVFPSPRHQGNHMSGQHVYRIVKNVSYFAGFTDVHPHILRHTCGTRMLELTNDLRGTQEFLGHEDPKTTAVYTKVRNERAEKIAGALDFEVGGGAGLTRGEALGAQDPPPTAYPPQDSQQNQGLNPLVNKGFQLLAPLAVYASEILEIPSKIS